MIAWRLIGSAGTRILSFGALLLLWQLGASVADPRKLPSPQIVLNVLVDGFADGTLPYHVGVTLARVAVSFALAMVIGVAVGIAMGRRPRLDRFFDGWLVLFLNVPALVTIVLCYIWFGLIETAAITAVALNKIPNVIVTLREGARSLNRDYLEMAAVFRLGPVKTLRHIVLPELYPFIVAAARSGLALIWKIVLVVEAFGRSNGVGFQVNTFFNLFDVAGILAYTIAFVAVIQVIELVLLRPIERRANRWRR